MCETYAIETTRLPIGRWAEAVEKLVAKVKPGLIHSTLTGPVLLSDFSAEMMSWGFRRMVFGVMTPFNNTPVGRLHDFPWEEATRLGRRCIIPLSAWYEFTGLFGSQRPREFRAADGGWLWAAGLWEFSERFGNCYSMLMTAPNDFMRPYYDTMPAILREEQALAWLRDGLPEIPPTDLPLDAWETDVHPITGRGNSPQGPAALRDAGG